MHAIVATAEGNGESLFFELQRSSPHLFNKCASILLTAKLIPKVVVSRGKSGKAKKAAYVTSSSKLDSRK